MTRRPQTLLDPYARGFREHLSSQGYSDNRACLHLRHMTHLGQWLEERGLDPGGFTQPHVDDFLVVRRAAYDYLTHLSMRGLAPMMLYLRQIDVVPPPTPSAPVDQMLEEFVGYLRRERGLAEVTVEGYRYTASRLLSQRASLAGAEGGSGIGGLGPQDITTFILGEADRRQAGALRQTVSAVRALLGFLHADGHLPTSLTAAALGAAGWRGGGLPRALEPGQVDQLLASCDRRTASGLRDYAILMLLWRLGLRAGEVAACRVGDVDWRRGEILVRGKGNRQETLPLPVDVGQALVDYCRQGRPQGSRCRALFVQKTAPHGPLSTAAVSGAVRQTCKRAGVPPGGAHRLRHTAATEMLRAGAPLAEIGQVLRHRDLATTALYAKVDRHTLRALARPWPGGVA